MATIKKPIYKDVSFESEKEFQAWLKKTTVCEIEFEDHGQDLMKIWIAENGEILHANLQASIWNGRFVDVENLEEFTPIHLYQGSESQRYINLVVVKIDKNEK